MANDAEFVEEIDQSRQPWRKKIFYRLAADTLLFIHLLFILFVIFGGFLTWRWRWVMWLHIPVALYGFLITVVGWVCPLTPMENRLRQAAGQEGYEGGFIEHYIVMVVYPPGLTPTVQMVAAAGLVVLMVISYGVPAVRSRRRSKVP